MKSIKKTFSSKKGQEEIIGFMLVVLVIVVVGLAFLFFLKPKESGGPDLQVENTLYSILSTSFEGQSLSARIDECAKGKDCETMGIGLKEVTNTAFEKSGLFKKEGNVKGYQLNITGEVNYGFLHGNGTINSKGAVVISGDNLIGLRIYS